MPELGESLGRYTLLRRLAAGGMGEIYLASRVGPLGFAPPIALKVLRDELAHDSTFVEMLVDEAKITMFLNHQNVVSVLDFGEQQGRYYIAMEYVQGVTLKQLLEALRARGQKLGVALAIYVGGELCRALKYAHTRTNHTGEPLNIVHRDVTPGNLLLSIQGEVKLADFGIARAKNRVHETQAGVLKGKFGYMAPEMLRYEQIDGRADLFCAGVLLYEMVTGRHPVEGASIMEAITRLENKDVEVPSNINPQVPEALDAILLQALEPKPADRWQSAAELGSALQELALQNAELRREVRTGAATLAGLIRELFPAAFENAIPPDLAERFLAEARKREQEARASLERRGANGTARNGAGAAAPRSESKTDGERETDEHARDDLLGDDDLEKTGEADLDRTGEQELTPEPEPMPTLAHPAPTPPPRKIPEGATLAFRYDSGLGVEDGELAIEFPDSSTDRARLREEMIEEPSRPKQSATHSGTARAREASSSAQMSERTLAVEGGFGAEPSERQLVDDSKTIATSVPDWRGYPSEPAPAVMAKTALFEESSNRYQEEELPAVSERASAYDDGATAFEPRAGAVFIDPSLGGDPGESTSSDPLPTAGADDTVLDGLSADAVAKARAELLADREIPKTARRANAISDDDAFVWEDSSEVSAQPKKLAGPLRIRVGPEGSPSIIEGKRKSQPVTPAPVVSEEIAETRVRSDPGKRPRPSDAQVLSGGPGGPGVAAAPEARGKVEIGAATGRWMRGELEAADLSWGDDAAARRAVATRNAAPMSPSARPAMTSSQVPVSSSPLGYGAPPGPPVSYSPQGGPGYPYPPGGAVPYPVPGQVPAQRSWAVPLAISLVMMAVVIVFAVLMLTRVAWPEVSFESEPTGAVVVLDGLVLPAKTPLTVKIKPNTVHRVEIRLQGMVRRLDTVEVGYLKPQTFRATFDVPARTVNIMPVPGRLMVNGQEIGSGAAVKIPSERMAPGPIELTVQADGYQPWTQRFASGEEIPASLDVVLSPN